MKPDFSSLITKEEALNRLFARWTPTPELEQVPLHQAAGRVLAEDCFAPYNLPVVRASAMDGVAVRSAAFADSVPDTSRWQLGKDYVRADTGDDFPDDFDAVIAIEDVAMLPEGGFLLRENMTVAPGMNVKPQGADVKKGTLLGTKNTVLSARNVAALGLGGFDCVSVVKKPRVAFIPSGSELVPVGTSLARGQNFDTNSLLVEQMLKDMGAEPVLFSIVPDDPAKLEAVLDKALAQADIILLNAGTSKGQEDFGARLLEQRGEVLFHGVAAVPGRPMSMAMIGGKPVVNLSGPTYAAFYSMDWAVRAMVCRALGIEIPRRHRVQAVLTAPLHTPPMLSMMVPIHVTQAENGTYQATPIVLRGPNAGGTAAALNANAVYISQRGETPKAAGQTIEVEWL